jgi:DNA-binding GntR family transcriptional regulator
MPGQISKPETNAKLVERAYTALREQILVNHLKPGHQALEEEISQHLGMSRTPVREALIRLSQEGLVEIVPRRGIRITPITPRDVREVGQVLACLECEAIRLLALRRPTRELLAPLDGAVAAMDAATEVEDMDSWSAADLRFHRLLFELCGNSHLEAAAQGFLDKAHRFRLLSTPMRTPPLSSNASHAAVVEAVRRGDPETAVAIHRMHKDRWSLELDVILSRLDLPGS